MDFDIEALVKEQKENSTPIKTSKGEEPLVKDEELERLTSELEVLRADRSEADIPVNDKEKYWDKKNELALYANSLKKD